MALVLNQRELYQHAVSHEYIIPAFNCFDIESMRAIVMAAEEEDSPVVLQVCMAMHNKVHPLGKFVSYIKDYLADAEAPVLLNHDHMQKIEDCMEAVDMGFPSVMFDGSHLLFEENVEKTKKVVEYAHANGRWVEAELGSIPGFEDIIFNAKTQRIGVCNACESLLVHRSIAKEFLPLLRKKLEEKQVEIRGDEDACAIEPAFVRATQEDWGREYLDYILSLKLVDSVDEAIRHINTYNTGHSETIVTSDYFNAQKFLNEVDAAAVYVNASTRFTDGEEFGFGAEIGISTQKLHARGPMGLKELTTTKYIIYGDGQIR